MFFFFLYLLKSTLIDYTIPRLFETIEDYDGYNPNLYNFDLIHKEFDVDKCLKTNRFRKKECFKYSIKKFYDSFSVISSNNPSYIDPSKNQKLKKDKNDKNYSTQSIQFWYECGKQGNADCIDFYNMYNLFNNKNHTENLKHTSKEQKIHTIFGRLRESHDIMYQIGEYRIKNGTKKETEKEKEERFQKVYEILKPVAFLAFKKYIKDHFGFLRPLKRFNLNKIYSNMTTNYAYKLELKIQIEGKSLQKDPCWMYEEIIHPEVAKLMYDIVSRRDDGPEPPLNKIYENLLKARFPYLFESDFKTKSDYLVARSHLRRGYKILFVDDENAVSASSEFGDFYIGDHLFQHDDVDNYTFYDDKYEDDDDENTDEDYDADEDTDADGDEYKDEINELNNVNDIYQNEGNENQREEDLNKDKDNKNNQQENLIKINKQKEDAKNENKNKNDIQSEDSKNQNKNKIDKQSEGSKNENKNDKQSEDAKNENENKIDNQSKDAKNEDENQNKIISNENDNEYFLGQDSLTKMDNKEENVNINKGIDHLNHLSKDNDQDNDSSQFDYDMDNEQEVFFEYDDDDRDRDDVKKKEYQYFYIEKDTFEIDELLNKSYPLFYDFYINDTKNENPEIYVQSENENQNEDNQENKISILLLKYLFDDEDNYIETANKRLDKVISLCKKYLQDVENIESLNQSNLTKKIATIYGIEKLFNFEYRQYLKRAYSFDEYDEDYNMISCKFFDEGLYYLAVAAKNGEIKAIEALIYKFILMVNETNDNKILDSYFDNVLNEFSEFYIENENKSYPPNLYVHYHDLFNPIVTDFFDSIIFFDNKLRDYFQINKITKYNQSFRGGGEEDNNDINNSDSIYKNPRNWTYEDAAKALRRFIDSSFLVQSGYLAEASLIKKSNLRRSFFVVDLYLKRFYDMTMNLFLNSKSNINSKKTFKNLQIDKRTLKYIMHVYQTLAMTGNRDAMWNAQILMKALNITNQLFTKFITESNETEFLHDLDIDYITSNAPNKIETKEEEPTNNQDETNVNNDEKRSIIFYLQAFLSLIFSYFSSYINNLKKYVIRNEDEFVFYEEISDRDPYAAFALAWKKRRNLTAAFELLDKTEKLKPDSKIAVDIFKVILTTLSFPNICNEIFVSDFSLNFHLLFEILLGITILFALTFLLYIRISIYC